MKLNLNLKMQDNSTAVATVERKVVKAKKEVLSFEDAWKEIIAKKNSEADLVKLREIYKAMKEGRIGREPGKESKALTKAEALRQWKVLQEMERGAKLEAMVQNTPDNFILVQTEDALMEMVRNALAEDIIAVDTETTGLDVYTDKMVGLSMSLPKNDLHYYVPVRHEEGKQVPLETVKRHISAILEDSTIEKIFHNAIFDLHIFAGEGLDVKGKIHCTQVIANLMNENEPSHKLKDLAPKYLKCDADTFDALFGKNCLFSTVELKYAHYYACKDTKLTLELFNFYMRHLSNPALERLKSLYDNIEQPLIKEVFYMERVGFTIDFEEVERQKVKLKAEKEELEGLLKVHFGDINFNSTVQLSRVLYEEKKLHLIKELPPNFDKSTKAKTLELLANYDESCALLIKYKEIEKHLSSFVEKIDVMIKPDGRIHGSFDQTGTVTGRFSSKNPNMQQQPGEARKMFIAPEGQLILGADFSAQEPRMLAHFTQDPTLLDIYREGKDLYSTYASLHYKRPYEEVYKNPDGSDTKERKAFKTVILAIMYGMTEKTLATRLKINELEAKSLIDSFFKGSPRVAKWIEHNKETARKTGYVETMFGRKRRLPTVKSTDKWVRMRAERQTTNARIQGSSADQTKLVMIKAGKTLREMSKPGREFSLLATIHDEVLFLVPEDVTKEEVKVIESLMVDTVKLNNVPSKTDIELGKCWGNLTSVHEWKFNK